ncbi:MAG: PAS domain S-box protein [Actinobacteria bacterium]|nr:MAG: PAS domain S-box protein [Actinomycetota bacterium]
MSENGADRLSESTRGRDRRARRVGQVGSERRLLWIVAVYLLVIGTILGYNAIATASERDAALVVNVAARQRAVAERYIKDVLLSLSGYPADPQADAQALQENAVALLDGGTVDAVQGADGRAHIPASNDWKVRAKLNQERRLIAKLVSTGDDLLARGPGAPDLHQRILQLRIIGAQVSTITNDAVGQMTRDVDATLTRLVRVGIFLGILGTLAALTMGFLLRRASAQRAAQFQSLIHNASDLITVIDRDLSILYASPSAGRFVGYSLPDLTGKNLSELVHPDDLPAVHNALDDLVEHPASTVNIDYRLRYNAESWRHVQTAATNLLHHPLVGCMVLNTRDITERVMAERQLQRLQLEQEKLLERTVQATEQERKRVAAELHDGPVQHLTALDVMLERARRTLDQPSVASQREAIEKVQGRIREEVSDLRKMMSELRPPALDNLGLVAALQEQLAALGREAGLESSIDSTLDTRLQPAQEIVLYRVAQEALTNTVKHAGADRVWILLKPMDGHVVLEVGDDGAGFDPSEAAASVSSGHFGLLGMRERIEMAGGKWDLVSGAGSGTVVRAWLPWAADSE